MSRNEPKPRGSALIAVVGVMAVGLLVVVLVSAALTSAFTYSSVAKSEVQAQAAAEGGVAAALAGLHKSGNCEAAAGTYQSASSPIYIATVWRSLDGLSWVRGCPLTSTTRVRIISSGSAQASAVLGASSGQKRIVEALYPYGKTGTGNQTAGSAMYVYSAGHLDTYEVLSLGGQNGDVWVRTSDFACTGPTVIEGSVIVAQGTASLTNTCIVKGSVLASGSIALTTFSRILGDATSSGGGVSISNVTSNVGGSVNANGSVSVHGAVNGSIESTGTVSLVSGGEVGGSIKAGAAVSIAGQVGGSVQTPGNLTVADPGHIIGSIKIGGTLTYGKLKNAQAASALIAAGMVGGTIAYGQTGIVGPVAKTAPVVSDWVDVSYQYSDWQALGFQSQLTWPSALGCRIGTSASTSPSGVLYPFYQQLKNLTEKTVVDGRGCSDLSGDFDLQLKTDVAFIGANFTYDTLKISSADGAVHKIWFIIPDAQPTVTGPQCSKKGGSFQINTPSVISENVIAMAYAPCAIAINNGTIWRGQLYSGSMVGGGGTRVLYYSPIGVPGSTIGGGSTTPDTYEIGTLLSLRNRTDNGE